MANAKNTEVRKFFTWRFLALNAECGQMIHVTAKLERGARQMLPLGMVAIFIARLPASEVAS